MRQLHTELHDTTFERDFELLMRGKNCRKNACNHGLRIIFIIYLKVKI